MAQLEKTALRQKLKILRGNFPLAKQKSASESICNQIQNLFVFQEAKQVAFYHAANGEVNLKNLFHAALLAKKICYFPALNQDAQLSFFPVTENTEFIPNHYGILEPKSREHPKLISALDIILIPLLGFDKTGARLGMGGGYYDKTLANRKAPLRIGVAYEFQRQPLIPTDEWDVPLSLIVTEKTIYRSPTCPTFG